MPETITSLIEKLEGAEVGSVELDALIYSHLNCTLIPRRADYRPRRRWPDGSVTLQRKVTASLDAALALAERLFPDWDWIIGRTNGGLTIHCQFGGKEYVFGNTPALALCAALLRAQSEARV